ARFAQSGRSGARRLPAPPPIAPPVGGRRAPPAAAAPSVIVPTLALPCPATLPPINFTEESLALAWKPAAGANDWIRKPCAANCSSCSQTSSPFTLGEGWQTSVGGVVVGGGVQS